MIIQAQVLNKLIRDNDTSLLQDFDSSYFSDYKEEFQFIQDHYNEYGKIPDQVTFVARFPNFDVLEVSEPDSYLVQELIKDKNTRFMANLFNQIRDLLIKNKIEEAMSLYKTAQESVVQAEQFHSVDILTDTSRFDRYVDRCKSYEKYFCRTGFLELDKLIGGWDRLEDLVTISARPGVGKSWIMLKFAVAALEQGLKVGVYSGEMTKDKVGYRFDTLSGHISNYGITRGNADLQNEYKKYWDTLSTRYKNQFRVLTPSMIGGPATVQKLRTFVDRDNLDILFVDQHSLLEDDRHGHSAVEKASNISRDLKNLQVMKQIPIIAVSQQNRDSTENGLDVSHIAQSDRIAQDSTIVLFIENKEDILTLYLSKSRDSETNKRLRYAVNLDLGIFKYIPTSEDGVTPEEDIDSLRQEFEEDVF